MTMNQYQVMSGEVYAVVAANSERAREVYLIAEGYLDGEQLPGEYCGAGEGETIVLPAYHADAIAQAVALISDALENMDPEGDIAARIGAALDLLTTGEHDCENTATPCYIDASIHECQYNETFYTMTCGTVATADDHCGDCCDCDDECMSPVVQGGEN